MKKDNINLIFGGVGVLIALYALTGTGKGEGGEGGGGFTLPGIFSSGVPVTDPVAGVTNYNISFPDFPGFPTPTPSDSGLISGSTKKDSLTYTQGGLFEAAKLGDLGAADTIQRFGITPDAPRYGVNPDTVTKKTVVAAINPLIVPPKPQPYTNPYLTKKTSSVSTYSPSGGDTLGRSYISAPAPVTKYTPPARTIAGTNLRWG